MSLTEEQRLHRNARCRRWYQGNKEKNREKINAASRKYYAANRFKVSVAHRKSRNKSYEKRLFGVAKDNAKRNGREFSIELSDIVIPETCPVLGIPLVRPGPEERMYAYPNRPSVDRRDNSLGYVKGNVFVISWRANRLKNDGTLDELRAVLRYMEGE